jgi:copper transport protein
MAKLLPLLVMLLGLLLPGSPALAHAALVAASPADGEVVASAPADIVLTFSEAVSPLVVKLIDPAGAAVPLKPAAQSGKTLRIAMPPDLGKGTHVLSWRVVSEDGHPVGGSIVFSIGAPGSSGMAIKAQVIDWPLRTAIWLARSALYLGLFFGIGGALFRAFIAPRTTPSASLALLIAGLVAAPLSIALQGLDALGLPLSAFANIAIWPTGLATSLGPSMALGFCALVLAAISLKVPGRALSRGLVIVSLAGLGAALAASGHASAANPQWLTRPAIFLHGVAIAFWAGALLPLAGLLRARSSESISALRCFSHAIPYALAPLILAGMVLAIVQLQSLNALWETAYGRVFLVKLALLCGVFALAVVNRWHLTAPVLKGDGAATRTLIRTILVETVLILAVMSVAALWRFTPPPRVLAELAALPASVHIHTGKAMAEVTVSPGHAGPVSASISLMSGDFGPLDAKALTLVLSNPAAGIEPFGRPAVKRADGSWAVADLTIPFPGTWSVRLDIRVSDFEMVSIDDRIEIRP